MEEGEQRIHVWASEVSYGIFAAAVWVVATGFVVWAFELTDYMRELVVVISAMCTIAALYTRYEVKIPGASPSWTFARTNAGLVGTLASFIALAGLAVVVGGFALAVTMEPDGYEKAAAREVAEPLMQRWVSTAPLSGVILNEQQDDEWSVKVGGPPSAVAQFLSVEGRSIVPEGEGFDEETWVQPFIASRGELWLCGEGSEIAYRFWFEGDRLFMATRDQVWEFEKQ